MIGKPALCACLLLGAAMAAMGQSRQENLNKCQADDLDTRTGCINGLGASKNIARGLKPRY